MKMLIDLYEIYNPTDGEEEISLYVQAKLTEWNIPFNVDRFHQIYSINDGMPLVCAHMDAVSTKPCDKIVLAEGKVFGTSNFGADDKNGVWIVLNLIHKYRDKVSFIFSAQEECGGVIDKLPIADMKDNVPYGLIFDRRGSGDIIGTYNNYCNDDLEDDIIDIGIGYGYNTTYGVFSDCDTLSEYIPCVNLSCGYYKAHTDDEYTVVSELYNSLNFGIVLIEGLPKDKGYKLAERTWSYWSRWQSYNDNTYYIGDWDCAYCGVTNYQSDTECWYCQGDEADCEVTSEDFEDIHDVLCPYCKSLTSESTACDECLEATYTYYGIELITETGGKHATH